MQDLQDAANEQGAPPLESVPAFQAIGKAQSEGTDMDKLVREGMQDVATHASERKGAVGAGERISHKDINAIAALVTQYPFGEVADQMNVPVETVLRIARATMYVIIGDMLAAGYTIKQLEEIGILSGVFVASDIPIWREAVDSNRYIYEAWCPGKIHISQTCKDILGQ